MTLIKTLLHKARLAFALFQVHSLERMHDDQTEVLNTCNLSQEDHLRIVLARAETRRNLASARAKYISLLPVGERMTFRSA